MKDFAERFYKSKRWQRCRDSYLKLRNGICERCGEAGNIVHHKIRLTVKNIHNPRITLCFDNLELLCIDCHNKEHADDMKSGRKKKRKPTAANNSRYIIDANGNILPPGQKAT